MLRPKCTANSAQAEASRYLREVKVLARLDEMRKQAINELGLTKKVWLERLKLMAFGCLADVVDLEKMRVKPEALRDDRRISLQEVSVSDKGIRFKSVDAKDALMDLGKALGFYSEKLTLDGKGGAGVTVVWPKELDVFQ
jgi:hypothetical protein